LSQLIQLGALGQKSGAGYYKKVGPDILRFDSAKADYVAGGAKAEEIVGRILKKPAPERLKLLRESSNPQAQFLWAVLRDSFHYCAVHLADVADCARDIDFAMRWGFGNTQGPFELWQEAGWLQVAQWVKEDIDAGKALCNAPLPDWVFSGPVSERGVHTSEGSWSASEQRYVPGSTLPVYQRQLFPETVLGSGAAPALKAGTELFKNDEIRVWTLDGEVLIASITAKLHLISPQVTESLVRAVDMAEQHYKGLVIWSPDDVFSAGANLEALMPVFMKSGAKGVEPEEKKLQDAMLRIRYASVPVVAALRGLALGGGCELAVHCAKRVASLESYVGLVEVGVGLVPGAGGLTYIARRAAEKAPTPADLLTFLKEGFTHAATAAVGTSAADSRRLGYLLDSDLIVPHKDELLYVALRQAHTLFDSGYRPPVPAPFPVAGRNAIATIQAQLVNMRDGGLISSHDFHIAALIADVLCGGDVDAGSLVTESYLMTLERKHFCALLAHPKSQERIMGMLQTGKPVRN
jgi:3-hydroxyacyl-CoA dehydrogenase